MIKKYEQFIFEQQLNGFNDGEVVYILYKIPGTDKREVVPVRIQNNSTGGYKFWFNVEGNPFPNQEPIIAPAIEDNKTPPSPIPPSLNCGFVRLDVPASIFASSSFTSLSISS